MERDKVYLFHIRDAIVAIEDYAAGMALKQFKENRLVQDAVVRQLEIIGEATKHLSDDLVRGHPAIPWRDIADMRNKLIHEYFGVDLETVWKVVKEDIPPLKAKVVSLLE